MSVTRDLYKWCESYLSNRTKFTTISDSSSGLASVDQGVQQEALIGPRFYSSHANNLTEEVVEEPNDDAEMFADDTTAFCFASDMDILTRKLQHFRNNMSNWAEKNGMVIHPGKTKVLILSSKTFIGQVQ